MKKEQKSNIMIINDMKVVSAKYGLKKGRTKSGKSFEAEEPTYQLSLKGEIPYEDFTAFDDTPEKMIPSWYKKQEGYMNLSSKFDIPVRREGRDSTMSEWMDEQAEKEYSCNGSTVRVKIKQADGVIYPVAVVVLEDGSPADPFEGMDE